MKSTDSSQVDVTLQMPVWLYRRAKAIAAKHKIQLDTLLLLLIWAEAQVSPGADVVLGKSHS